MSFSSFYTGLTGLKAHSVALNVIGNNLANVDTVGFKASRVSFSELFSSAGGFGVNGAGVPHQVGSGVQLGAVQQLFAQGSLQTSDVTTDLAIQGNGFFALKTADGAPVYSRSGNFSFNSDGYLVDPNGYRVQGYTARNSAGDIVATGDVSDIQIPTGVTAPPQESSYFQVNMNLNSAAAVDNPATTSANEAEVFSTGVTVYDALGAEHNMTMLFTPVDTNSDGHLDQWQYQARIPTSDIAPPTGGWPAGTADYQTVASGTVSFDSNGRLSAPSGNVEITIPTYANGAAGQSVEWRLFDPNAAQVPTRASVTGAAAIPAGGLAAAESLTVTVNGAATTVALAAGDTASAIVSKINTALGSAAGAYAFVDSANKVGIASSAFGPGQSVSVTSTGAGTGLNGLAGSGGTGMPTVVTGYASSSAVNNLGQDGYGMGRLQSLAVDNSGLVSGVFTNGQTIGLAQVAVASFNAPEGLLRLGNNAYQASIGSGPAALGAANSGGRGKIASRSLELSNVDITDEFTQLIITERGYQANSRVITTTDTVMQEALRLKQ